MNWTNIEVFSSLFCTIARLLANRDLGGNVCLFWFSYLFSLISFDSFIVLECCILRSYSCWSMRWGACNPNNTFKNVLAGFSSWHNQYTLQMIRNIKYKCDTLCRYTPFNALLNALTLSICTFVVSIFLQNKSIKRRKTRNVKWILNETCL